MRHPTAVEAGTVSGHSSVRGRQLVDGVVDEERARRGDSGDSDRHNAAHGNRRNRSDNLTVAPTGDRGGKSVDCHRAVGLCRTEIASADCNDRRRLSRRGQQSDNDGRRRYRERRRVADVPVIADGDLTETAGSARRDDNLDLCIAPARIPGVLQACTGNIGGDTVDRDDAVLTRSKTGAVDRNRPSDRTRRRLQAANHRICYGKHRAGSGRTRDRIHGYCDWPRSVRR
jgi:hypothetical protein